MRTTEYKKCEMLGDRIEPLIVQQIFGNYFQISHDMFILDPIITDIYISILIVIYSMAMNVFIILLNFINRNLVTDRRSQIIYAVDATRHLQRCAAIALINHKASQMATKFCESMERKGVFSSERSFMVNSLLQIEEPPSTRRTKKRFTFDSKNITNYMSIM